MTISYAQIFCSVADLVADQELPGGNDALLYQVCRSASDYLQKEIGHFVPVTDSLLRDGNWECEMRIPPTLAVTSLSNYGVTLTEDVDFWLRPQRRRWPNGPFTWLEVVPTSSRISYWGAGAGSSLNRGAVLLAGRFGLYERSVALGAEVDDATGQTSGATTLQVDNGAKVGAGMVLKIESEQQLITGWESAVSASTTLGAAISTAAIDTITLADGTKVNIGEVIQVEFEQMKVRDKTGNSAYVFRGWNGTGKVTHANGLAVSVLRNLTVERGVNGTTAAAHAKDTAISRYVPPDDILFLAKEISTLMLNKAASGYQGRVGGTGVDAQGVQFYNDAFPRFDIERIKSKYMIGEV